jgi:hypothetical protein
MLDQNITPAQALLSSVASAINEFKANQGEEVTYYDLNIMLNAAWEILSEVPTAVDESLEERITGLTAELDDIVSETFITAEEHEGEGDLLVSREGELV